VYFALIKVVMCGLVDPVVNAESLWDVVSAEPACPDTVAGGCRDTLMDSVAVLRFAFSEALEEARVMMPRKESCTPREAGFVMLLCTLAMEEEGFG